MYIALFVILAIIILYLFLISPKIFGRRDLSHLTGHYYAHRGLHKSREIPENSLEAFKLASENNYAIELDVQLTKDGEPVVFHDYSLERLCGRDILVEDLDYEELKKFTLYDTSEPIPHIKDVLDLVDGRVPLLVELKTEAMDSRLCQALVPYLDDYKGDFSIESFNPLVLNWFKKNRPSILRGQLSSDFVKSGEKGDKKLYFLLKNFLINFLARPDFIAYNYYYRKDFSFRLVKTLFKTPSFAWTIVSKEDLEDLRDDFDVFIFENFLP